MPGLYFHIPFCKQACHYCDFHFSTNLNYQDEMVEAMTRELHLQKNYLQNRELTSIYFGGGTPSLLESRHFEKIFNSIAVHFTLEDACEITVEANPDDLSSAKLSTFLKAGVNRLSIGIQSFDDSLLKFLNRAHDGQMAIKALEKSRNAGFEKISLDLIYAIPGQEVKSLLRDLDTALKFTPEHFSAYALTIEPKTVFGNWENKKKLIPVNESVNAKQYKLLVDYLAMADYDHYEISNFCKQGLYSKHNSSYWMQTPYLGIGPSAHSYDTHSRQFNIKNNALYIKSINKSKVPFEIEWLTMDNKINEYVFTTLRTIWGCDLEKLKLNYSFDLLDSKKEYIEKLVANEMATLEQGILKLTFKGKLLADQIALDLMV